MLKLVTRPGAGGSRDAVAWIVSGDTWRVIGVHNQIASLKGSCRDE
jgi:hypothetical protein